MLRIPYEEPVLYYIAPMHVCVILGIFFHFLFFFNNPTIYFDKVMIRLENQTENSWFDLNNFDIYQIYAVRARKK